MLKTCPGCKTELDSSFFNKANRRDGLRSYCKSCDYARVKSKQDELKLAVFNKLGHVCSSCGYSDKRALQIDHVNGGGNQEHKRIKNACGFLKKVIADTNNEYQILCANCNWIKRMENKEHPRGNNLSKEGRLKIKEARQFWKPTDEQREAMKTSHLGQIPWNKTTVREMDKENL